MGHGCIGEEGSEGCYPSSIRRGVITFSLKNIHAFPLQFSILTMAWLYDV